MRPETVAILVKLSKGKTAFSEEALLAFHNDLKTAGTEEFLAALYRPKPKKVAAPKPPVPAWLSEIEAARKRLKWTPAQACKALVQLVIDEGLISSDPFAGLKSAPSFGVAAKKIGMLADGEKVAAAFSKEVGRLEREYALG
ncbi:MAG: hypothetical protein IV086_10350 [Hyphomonadaceae bacterium]|nr:hypothetical protein [Hyphomonadaceae bacterium]